MSDNNYKAAKYHNKKIISVTLSHKIVFTKMGWQYGLHQNLFSLGLTADCAHFMVHFFRLQNKLILKTQLPPTGIRHC